MYWFAPAIGSHWGSWEIAVKSAFQRSPARQIIADTRLGDPKRSIDHETGAHHGDMESVGAPGGFIWHGSHPIREGNLRLAGAAT